MFRFPVFEAQMLPIPVIESLRPQSAKLGPSRKACVQTSLSGNLGWEVCGSETWFIKEWQGLSILRLSIMVLEWGRPLPAVTSLFYVTSWNSELISYKQ